MILNSDYKTVLENSVLGKFLTTTELETLINHSQILSFAPGEMILQQGKKSQGLYIIIIGKALVTAKILGEGGTYIATLGQGNILGEISLIEDGPCVTTVMASTEVKCLLIPALYFDMLAFFFPKTKYKLSKAIMSEICERIKDLHNKICNFMANSDMVTRSKFGVMIAKATAVLSVEKEKDFDQEALKQSDFFKIFSQEEYDELLKHSTVIQVAKYTTLIEQGESDSACYIIVRGAVKATFIHKNKVAKLAVLGPISLFTNVACIDARATSLINYTTCERAILLKLAAEDLAYLQKNKIKLWYKLFELICESFVNIEKSADKLDIRLNGELYNREGN